MMGYRHVARLARGGLLACFVSITSPLRSPDARQPLNHVGVRASQAPTGSDIEVPGTIGALPHANGVVYESPLPAAARRVTARQALNAAEKEFTLTDSQINKKARAVPVVLSIGQAPGHQHMKAWVVTANVDMALPSRPGTRGTVAHKLCIVIDAATGTYIMAYPAGPRDTLPY